MDPHEQTDRLQSGVFKKRYPCASYIELDTKGRLLASDRRTDRQIDRWADGQMERGPDGHTARWKDGYTDRLTD